MRFYKVSLQTVEAGDLGAEWYTDLKTAKRSADDFERFNAEDDPEAVVTPVDIQPTKAGILAALKMHATHPDNG